MCCLYRLQELQQQMVGGEAVNNAEVKERHKKRMKHADETQKRLAGQCPIRCAAENINNFAV